MRLAFDIITHAAGHEPPIATRSGRGLQKGTGVLLCALLATGTLAGATGGCDDAPPPSTSQRRQRGPRRAKAPPPPVAKKVEQSAPSIPERALTEKDFTEGPENRDPFRTFLAELKPGIKKKGSGIQVPIVMPRYGLDELKLIAVVTGSQVRPLAMFRTPRGLGVTVQRGQRISKNAAKIKRILPDKVVVEIDKQHEDTKTKAERVIELHPKEAVEPLLESADRAMKLGPNAIEPLEEEGE